MSEVSELDEYRSKVAERVGQEEDVKKPKSPDTDSTEPDLDFVRRCYMANEVGDSLLYNHLHRDQFLYNVVSGRWMYYHGPHWDIDYHNKTKAAAEAVVGQYLRLLEPIEEELGKLSDSKDDAEDRRRLNFQKKTLIERLNRLRSDRGRNSMLNCAVSNSDPLTITPDVLDQQPWLFPCKNGIINLQTGQFREGLPSDYITVASPTEWTGINAPCPNWEKFLNEVLDCNQDVIGYLQKILGYAITGLKTERLFVVLYSPHGQNGKGTLIEVLYNILGKLALPIETELLMSQKFGKSSGSASPDIVALKGKRLIWASETEERNSFAAGKIKLMSGGDPLTGRGISDKDYTTFDPTHLLFLLCNNLPKAPAKDSAFWERIKVFLFPYSFVTLPTQPHQRKRNGNLLQELESESSGILAWMARGTKRYQEEGLIPPQKILDDSLDYRSHEDDIQEFIDANCHVDFDDASVDNRCSSKETYQLFRTWWEENNSTRPMNQKDFSDQLQLKGFKKVKSSGVFYQFIRLALSLGN